jgi:hypothetical protein
MNYLLGTWALLGVGFIGLLIELRRQDKDRIEHLEFYITQLQANQKPVPWNKGKKGYKLTRKPKSAVETLLPLPEVGDSIALFTPRLD